MKKHILLGLLVVPFFGMAQTSNKSEVTKKVNMNDVQTATDNQTTATSTSSTTTETTEAKQAKVQNYSAVKIGETFYDLQTNASIGRRVVLHSDGSVSAVWTTSNVAANGWPNRGSGYNHNDGTSWGMVSSDRIENSTRTGWPSIGVIDGKEFIISHESNNGGFGISMNGSVGSTSFTTEKALDDERVNENRVPIWGRAAAGGDYIHLISNYWFSEDNNVPRVTMNGVQSPTTYTRMYKGPDSIEVFHSTLPGYDSTRLTFGGGDTYAIDVQDSVVAIAIGGRVGEVHSVYLWKSTDYGRTWEIKDVDKYPYYGNLNGLYGDTVWVNDGSVDVMIDDNNNAHVAWGAIRITENDTTDDEGTYVFYPYQAGLFHWSEEFDVVNRCGALIDADMNGEQNINEETITALNANGEIPTGLDGSTIPFFAARYGSTGIITHPSLSMDANGNVFVVYSAPIEYDIHPRQANYRDILVSYSDDGGQTWYGPQNIVQSRGYEDVFGCVAKRSNDFLHLIYQTDVIPGTHLQNDGTAGLHPNDKCDINYIAVPVSDILNDVIGQNTLNTEEVYKEENVFVVSQNYPNPFNGTTEVVIYLRNQSDINVTITDVTGKVVSEVNYGTLTPGNHELEMDASGFESGVYFYTVRSGSNAVTRKMQVH
jgi:hypothetical protein